MKLHAQEHGETLAIVQARELAKHYKPLSEAERTVYQVSIHHRRAYLSVTKFSEQYLKSCDKGYIFPETRVVVRRSRKYRLDVREDRCKFGRALYILIHNVGR